MTSNIIHSHITTAFNQSGNKLSFEIFLSDNLRKKSSFLLCGIVIFNIFLSVIVFFLKKKHPIPTKVLSAFFEILWIWVKFEVKPPLQQQANLKLSFISGHFRSFYLSKLFMVGTFSATILKRALITSNAIYRYFRLIIIPFLALKFAFYNSIGVLFDVFWVNSWLNFQCLCFLIL